MTTATGRQRVRTIILGAAGRDFHDFNLIYRGDPETEVVAFTAQQIPHIDDRRYPPVLAGPLYPDGIPIRAEDDLEALIAEFGAERCVMAYSDVSYDYVMHLASRCNAAGADFVLLAADRTMIRSKLPVVAVCAVRTGVGKSQTSRAVARILKNAGLRVGILRHPMPYGDLAAQAVQRFASEADLVKHKVTIEEREEYEPHVAAGMVIWAGADYGAIVDAADDDADVLLWDGGNNDTSFLKPTLLITLVDPHRPGHESRYYPGETNVRMADAILINKVETAAPQDVEMVRANVKKLNPRAVVLTAASPIVADDEAVLRGRRVLAIEDGPTVTHGGMKYGAATIAARRLDCELVDPRPFAVGEIATTFERYPGLGPLLPAMGYGEAQIHDLETTIANAAAAGVEAVAIGTPIDLGRIVRIPLPFTRVRYELEVLGEPTLESLLEPVIRAAGRPAAELAGRSGA